MDRPSAKSREWVFFRDESGRIAFNPKCSECAKECKQSFRATLVRCPVFVKKNNPDEPKAINKYSRLKS